MAIREEKIIEWAQELQSLSAAGLHYCKDRFDRERYERMRDIAAEMVANAADLKEGEVKAVLSKQDGYQTPKLCSRAIIFNAAGEILLVKEWDGKWAPPGGWCEYNKTPAENVVKEAWEEAGLKVVPYRFVFMHDQHRHNHPKNFFNVEKCFFLCRVMGGSFQKNLETVESRYFPLDKLPELNTEKATEEQLRLCYQAYQAETWEMQYDC